MEEAIVEPDDSLVCVDALKEILRQPREEMNIVQLMRADPRIRELLMQSSSMDRHDSIMEESEEDDSAIVSPESDIDSPFTPGTVEKVIGFLIQEQEQQQPCQVVNDGKDEGDASSGVSSTGN